MTTLDQAFIKAYLRQDEVPSAPLRFSEPVRLDDAIGELPAAEPANRAPDVAAARLAEAVADALGSHRPAMATIGWSTACEPPAIESPEAPRIDLPAESTPLLDDVGPVSFVALLDSGDRADTPPEEAYPRFNPPIEAIQPTDRTSSMLPGEPPQRSNQPEESELPEPSEPLERTEEAQENEGLSKEPWATEVQHPADNEQPTDHLSAEDQESSSSAERVEESAAAARVFQPLLRVERLKWPSDCDRLDRKAASEVDRLADALLKESARGRNVLGFGAEALGEGTTTMLLCAARRLAARGVKVVIVDADFDHPCLALRLRLAVQSGWEDTLADRVPLDEVVIESDHDGLALLPWREPSSPKHPPTAGQRDPAPSIRLLGERYDLVLVDLGKLDDETLAGMGVAAPPARWIDAVILVHNVRDTAPADLDRLRQRVRTCGLVEAGVAENFA